MIKTQLNSFRRKKIKDIKIKRIIEKLSPKKKKFIDHNNYETFKQNMNGGHWASTPNLNSSLLCIKVYLCSSNPYALEDPCLVHGDSQPTAAIAHGFSIPTPIYHY